MKKRAAIELSANALVIIIISVVILGLSIVLMKNILVSSTDQTTQLDARAQQEIENLLIDPSARVVLPSPQKEVSRGSTAVFGLGVKNVLGTPTPTNFYATVAFDKAYDKNNAAITCATCSSWIKALDFNKAVSIENTKEHLFAINIVVPKSTTAKSGTYIYNVKVCYAGGTDDSCATGYKTSYIDGGMKKIYVIVK